MTQRPIAPLRMGLVTIREHRDGYLVTSSQLGGTCGIYYRFSALPNTLYEVSIDAFTRAKGNAGFWIADRTDKTLIWKQSIFGPQEKTVNYIFPNRKSNRLHIGIMLKNPAKGDTIFIKNISFTPKINNPKVTLSNKKTKKFYNPITLLKKQPKNTVSVKPSHQKTPTITLLPNKQSQTITHLSNKYPISSPCPYPANTMTFPTNSTQLTTSFTNTSPPPITRAETLPKDFVISQSFHDQLNLIKNNIHVLREKNKTLKRGDMGTISDPIGTLRLMRELLDDIQGDTSDILSSSSSLSLKLADPIKPSEQKETDHTSKQHKNRLDVEKKIVEAENARIVAEKKAQDVEQLRIKAEEKIRIAEKQKHDIEQQLVIVTAAFESAKLAVEQKTRDIENINKQERAKAQHNEKELIEKVKNATLKLHLQLQEQERLRQAEEEKLKTIEAERIELQKKVFEAETAKQFAKIKVQKAKDARCIVEKEQQDAEEKLRKAILQRQNSTLKFQRFETEGQINKPDSPRNINDVQLKLAETSVQHPNKLREETEEKVPLQIPNIKKIALQPGIVRRILCWIPGDFNISNAETKLLDRWVKVVISVKGTEIHVVSQKNIDPEKTPLSDETAANTKVKFFQPIQFSVASFEEDTKLLTILKELDEGYQYERVFIASSTLLRDRRIFTLFANRIDLYINGSLFETPHVGDIEHIDYAKKYCSSIWCSSHAVKNCVVETLKPGEQHLIISFMPILSDTASLESLPKLSKKIKICYIGSISQSYMIHEIISAFGKVRELTNNAELHIYGIIISTEKNNKILLQKLKKTPGIYYHENISEKDALSHLEEYHLGIYFRSRLFDNDLEIPEILVKFSGAGLPCLVNEYNYTIKEFFGEDYNGYMADITDIAKKIFFYSRNRHAYETDQMNVIRAAKMCTFSSQKAKVKYIYNRSSQ